MRLRDRVSKTCRNCAAPKDIDTVECLYCGTLYGEKEKKFVRLTNSTANYTKAMVFVQNNRLTISRSRAEALIEEGRIRDSLALQVEGFYIRPDGGFIKRQGPYVPGLGCFEYFILMVVFAMALASMIFHC